MAHKSDFKLNGVTIPSVTQVLDVIGKPGLYRWYAKYGWDECERIKRESQVFGSAVHDGIEKALTDGTIPDILRGRQRELVERTLKWVNESKFRVISQETHVIHKKLKYHGTFDALGEFEAHPGVLWVIDWKSSKRIDPSYAMQIAAYAAAYNAEKGLTWKTGVSHGGVVRLEKDPEAKKQFEVASFSDLEENFEGFKAARALYAYLNERG